MDPAALLAAVVESLRARGIPNAAYGGMALAVYGEPRETRDADSAIHRKNTQLAINAITDRFPGSIVAFQNVPFGGLILSRITILPESKESPGDLNVVDLVSPADEDYEDRAARRFFSAVLNGRPTDFISPEDFVIYKVLSTRAKDLEDAATVLKRSGAALDVPLIDQEITKLAVGKLLHPIAARWQQVRSLAAT